MNTFYQYDAVGLDAQKLSVTISTGPVLFDSQNKVLLHRSKSTNKFQFIGGRLRDNLSPQANAIAHAAHDFGIAVKLDETIPPFVIMGTVAGVTHEVEILLIHYLASFDETREIRGNAQWFSVDEVRTLDADGGMSSKNVLLATEHFLKVK